MGSSLCHICDTSGNHQSGFGQRRGLYFRRFSTSGLQLKLMMRSQLFSHGAQAEAVISYNDTTGAKRTCARILAMW